MPPFPSKKARDRLEGIPVTNIYYGLSWFATLLCLLLLAVGLWNVTLALSEKGFYVMSVSAQLVRGHCGAEKYARCPTDQDRAVAGQTGSNHLNFTN